MLVMTYLGSDCAILVFVKDSEGLLGDGKINDDDDNDGADNDGDDDDNNDCDDDNDDDDLEGGEVISLSFQCKSSLFCVCWVS